MLDIEGCELSAEDRELIRHPAVGGVILFTRNFESVEQVADLVATGGLGDGVWEGLRVHNGRIAFQEQHFDRLYEGAKAIDLDIGMDRAALETAIRTTLDANEMRSGVHVRLMVTRGIKAIIAVGDAEAAVRTIEAHMRSSLENSLRTFQIPRQNL